VVAGAFHDSHSDLTEGLAQSGLASVDMPLQGVALGDSKLSNLVEKLSNLVEWGAPTERRIPFEDAPRFLDTPPHA
jgi:hypothetical protein